MKFVEDLYSYETWKWELLDTYRSFRLEEVLDGKIDKNRSGEFYLLSDSTPIQIELSIQNDQPLDSELRLVKGIGEKRDIRLKEEGVEDLNDLIEKRTYRERAKEIIDEIERDEYFSIYKRIKKNLQRSHPLYLSLISSMGLNDLLIFDIESLGFSGDPIFLIGTATFAKDRLIRDQFLARDIDEEKNILWEFKKRLEDKPALVSFNGRRFDEKLIKMRAKKYDIEIPFSKPHIDILPLAKKRWSERCDSWSLSNLEKEILNIEREKDLPGILIPHFYQLYLEKENPGTLFPIIEHNKRDLISIGKLLDHL